jgi:hypothetical protein
MTAIANDAGRHIGRPLSVFWVDDDAWYSGHIDDYQPNKGWHIQYDDGEVEWLLSLDENVAFDDSDRSEKSKSGHNVDCSDQLGYTSDTFTSEPEMNIYSDPGDEPTPSLKEGTRVPYDFQSTEDFKSASHSIRSHLGNFDSRDSSDRQKENADYHGAEEQRSCRSSAELESAGNLLHRSDQKDDYEGSSASVRIIRNEVDDVTSFGRRTERIEDSSVPARCLLLLGTIFGASNLPDIDDSETDGKCFFRVLYVEGTGASTMFRCKTPIFSSNVTDDLNFPRWNEASRSFHFEMALPESSRSDRSFKLEGQITVALYRVRGQGGFGFIGQTSFEIMDLIEKGTKVSHQEAEARFIGGDYPLIDRLDRALKNGTEVQLSLQIAWRSDSDLMNVSDASQSSRVRPSTMKSGRGNGNSFVQEEKSVNRSRIKSSRSDCGDASQSRSSLPRIRPSSAAVTSTLSRGPPPVKVVSAQQRKQVEERRRIEAQNKLLHSRLQSKGTKCRSEAVGSIYKTSNLNASVKSPSSNSSIGRGQKSFEKNPAPTLNDVMATWTLLKKDVSEIEDKNLLLKATLSKLKLQTKRQTLATDRIKKESKVSTVNDNANISCLARPDSVLGGRRYTHDDAAIKKNGTEVQIDDDGEFADIDDVELREVAMENFVLQQLRRDLINRAKTAIATRNEHISTVIEAEDSAGLLRARVALAVPSIVPLPEGQDTLEHRNLRCLVNDLHNSKLAFLCAEAVLEHGFHIGPLLDAIHEDRCLLKLLKRKLEEVQQEAEVCKSNNQYCEEKLSKLIEEKGVFKIRENIASLRIILSNLRTKKCLDNIRNGTTSTEREIAQFH